MQFFHFSALRRSPGKNCKKLSNLLSLLGDEGSFAGKMLTRSKDKTTENVQELENGTGKICKLCHNHLNADNDDSIECENCRQVLHVRCCMSKEVFD